MVFWKKIVPITLTTAMPAWMTLGFILLSP
jgi:hypothetical protein